MKTKTGVAKPLKERTKNTPEADKLDLRCGALKRAQWKAPTKSADGIPK